MTGHPQVKSKVCNSSLLTVCAAADRGVRCTGVRLFDRLSHNTI